MTSPILLGSAQPAPSSVGSSQIADDSITPADLAPLTVEDVTAASYTFVLADAEKVKRFDRATAQAVTVPTNASVPFAVGTVIEVMQVGAGTVTLAGDTGVTVNGPSLVLGGQYQGGRLFKTGTNRWLWAPYSGTSALVLYSGASTGAALNAFLADYGEGADPTGITVVLPVGTLTTDEQILVPQKVTLRGQGRSSSIIAAGASFPADTAVVKLGGAETASHGCRLERLTVDCNEVAGSVGVYSASINEQSGCHEVVVIGVLKYGVQFVPAGAQVPQNYYCSEVEVLLSADADASAVGVYLNANGSKMQGFDGLTVATVGLEDTSATGIRLEGCGGVINGAHVEHVATGLLIGSTAGCSGLVVNNMDGHTSVTDLVKIDNATESDGLVFLALRKRGGTNIIVDEINGVTLTDVLIGFYTSSPTYGAMADTFDFSALAPAFSNVGWATYSVVSVDYYNSRRATDNTNQNNEVVYRLPSALRPGTWTFVLVHRTVNNNGIYTIAVSPDGVTWTDLTTIDGYTGGSATSTRTAVTGLTIPLGASMKFVRIKMATKNASSSAYGGIINQLAGVRTGA